MCTIRRRKLLSLDLKQRMPIENTLHVLLPWTLVNTTCTHSALTLVSHLLCAHTHLLPISGLAKMHSLTSVKARPVRFRAGLWNGTEYTFQFDTFQVLDKSTNYKLRLDHFNKSASSTGIDQETCKNNFMRNANKEFSTIRQR